MTTMNYIGLDVRKMTISYCVKDVSGRIQREGRVGCNSAIVIVNCEVHLSIRLQSVYAR
jgi:hypothetical protein